MEISRPAHFTPGDRARSRLLWLAIALSVVCALYGALSSPFSLLVALPAIAVSIVLFRDRRRVESERADLEQEIAALAEASGDMPVFEGGIRELLVSARSLFRAGYAEILVLPEEPDEPAYRNVISRDGERTMTPETLTEGEILAVEAIRRRGRQPIVVSAETAGSEIAGFLEARRLRDGIIGILKASRGDLGIAVVGDLAAEEGEHAAEDSTVFAAFCGHASVVLEIAWLGRSLAELTEMKERLHHQAFHDALTGLPNRVLFSERVAGALDRSRSEGAEYGPTVLLLDLDNFKIVNDTWGHAAGDDLLVAVADRLRLAIRPTDLPARLGGDEFAILLDDPTPTAGEAAAERITLLFAEPFHVHDRSVQMRPSVGIATAGQGISAEQLLRHADEAMYEAKADEIRHVAAYEPESHAATRRRGELQFELADALERHQIELRFQPVVSLEDGSVQAFESLVRWAHPSLGLMPPGEFLHIADNQQLGKIGRIVMREACRHAFLWQDTSGAGRPIGVWINLSAVDLTSDTLVEEVTRQMALTRLDPGHVTLEITETSVIVGQETAVENVRALRALGVRIAIDDFGTGYSSLSRLGEFPLDMLKIPMPFVERLSEEQADQRLVDGIIRLADSLGLGIVAEGVERELQAEILRQLGCQLAQGYHYAPPMDAETVMRLLRSGLHLPHARGFGAHPSTYQHGETRVDHAA
jgi:diguanylate cyclase (GGDEF)-like protein